MELRSYGGIYGGNTKATNFLCLTLKMLQIQPDKDIVLEFIRNEDYKYVRLLGAFYLRLVGKPLEIYQYLEPLLNDFRKIRYNDPQGKMQVRHVDEFIHDLLSKDTFCDTALHVFRNAKFLKEQDNLNHEGVPWILNSMGRILLSVGLTSSRVGNSQDQMEKAALMFSPVTDARVLVQLRNRTSSQ